MARRPTYSEREQANIAEWVWKARAEFDTQRALARALDVSEQHLSAVLGGGGPPGRSVVVGLAKLFAVSEDIIVRGERRWHAG